MTNRLNFLLCFAFITFLLTSCNKPVQTPAEASMDSTQVLLLKSDSILFDEAFINAHYAQREVRPLTNAEREKYETGADAPMFSIMDSVRLNDNVYSYFVKAKTKHGFKVYMTNYSSQGNYLDSRMIYNNTSIPERRLERVHSKLYLPTSKVLIYDNNAILGEYKEIPMNIDANGMFEDFPEVPFEDATIAISSCEGGLLKKHPLREKWTVFNFEHQKSMIVETTRNYNDYVDNYNTMYTPELLNGDGLNFDLAFKGEYPEKHMELRPIEEEKNYDKAELEGILSKYKSELNELANNTPYEISAVYSFSYDSKKYRLVHYTSKEYGFPYTAVLGITPDGLMKILAYQCLYNYYSFRLRNDVMFYIRNTSCGEGLVATTSLYKIDGDFEKIFESTIACD